MGTRICQQLLDSVALIRVARALDNTQAQTGVLHTLDIGKRTVSMLASSAAAAGSQGKRQSIWRFKTNLERVRLVADLLFVLDDWQTRRVRRSLIDGSGRPRHLNARRRLDEHRAELEARSVFLADNFAVARDSMVHGFLDQSKVTDSHLERFSLQEKVRHGAHLLTLKTPDTSFAEFVFQVLMSVSLPPDYAPTVGTRPFMQTLLELEGLLNATYRGLLEQYAPSAFIVLTGSHELSAYRTRVEGKDVVALSYGLQNFMNRGTNLYIATVSPQSLLHYVPLGGHPMAITGADLEDVLRDALSRDAGPLGGLPVIVRLLPHAQNFKSRIEWALYAFVVLHEIAHGTEDTDSLTRYSSAEAMDLEARADAWAVDALGREMRRIDWDTEMLHLAKQANRESRSSEFSGGIFPADTDAAAFEAGLLVLAILAVRSDEKRLQLSERAQRLESIALEHGVDLEQLRSNQFLRALRSITEP